MLNIKVTNNEKTRNNIEMRKCREGSSLKKRKAHRTTRGYLWWQKGWRGSDNSGSEEGSILEWPLALLCLALPVVKKE
jgi:hypothetical protein